MSAMTMGQAPTATVERRHGPGIPTWERDVVTAGAITRQATCRTALLVLGIPACLCLRRGPYQ